MRERDEVIPADETLYRWLTHKDVNGSSVLPTAVDLQGTSVERLLYFVKRESQSEEHPERNGLARICEAQFPANLVVNDVSYEFFTYDCPELDNDAHAEIRVARKLPKDGESTDRPAGFKPKSQAAKIELRLALAAKMAVERSPSPVCAVPAG